MLRRRREGLERPREVGDVGEGKLRDKGRRNIIGDSLDGWGEYLRLGVR